MSRDVTTWTLDRRPVVAIDWSLKAVHATFDGDDVQMFATIDDLVASLKTPHKIAAEATVESWDPDRRALAIEGLRQQGHELYVYRPLRTARARGDRPKTDAEDARVIFELATGGVAHLYPIHVTPDPGHVAQREDAVGEYLRIRLMGEKVGLTAAAEEVLGPYEDLDEETASVLGNGRGYSNTLLAVVYFVAQRAATRAEFERLLGLHGSAYPSLLRSELHHHCFRHARKRGVAWPLYRRVLRRTYRQLRTHLEATDAVAAVQ